MKFLGFSFRGIELRISISLNARIKIVLVLSGFLGFG